MTIPDDKIQRVAALHARNAAADGARVYETIRVARAARAGATQPELARRAGVSVQTLSNMETGTCRPNLETVTRTLRALGYKLMAVPVSTGLIHEDATLEELDGALIQRAELDQREHARAMALASSALDALGGGTDPWPWAEAGAPVPAREV